MPSLSLVEPVIDLIGESDIFGDFVTDETRLSAGGDHSPANSSLAIRLTNDSRLLISFSPSRVLMSSNHRPKT